MDPIADPGATGAETEAILQILAKETGMDRDRLQRSARLSDLEIPSLDLVQTIFELETRFNIEIPVIAERSGAEFETVGDLIDHVQAAIDRTRTELPGAPA